MMNHKKNVVVIGGGTGSSNLIRAIKRLDINLFVISTVFDSGGSTGILREEFNIPAVGDIRQILIALANNNAFWNKLMNYRFNEISSLNPHSLGNLIIASLIDIKHDFYSAIKSLSEVFNINGEIVPITNNPNIHMKAIYEDNSYQEYEHLIPNVNKKIQKLTFNEINFDINPRAIEVLTNADYIILSSGSLYTSVIVNIVIDQIKEAISNNKNAKLIYLSNLVTQNGETDNMSIQDHISEIEKNLINRQIDIVIANNKINCCLELINKYLDNKQTFLIADESFVRNNPNKLIILDELIDQDNIINIRHDKNVLNKIFKSLFNC